VNPLRYNNFNRTNITNRNWAHNPAHRGAVPYRDANVAQRFGNQGAAARESFRGKADAGRQQLSKGNTGPKATPRTNAKSAGNAASKQGGSKQAARTKQGGSKQAAARSGPKKTAANQRSGNRQAGRPSTTGQRSPQRSNVRASPSRNMSHTVGRGGASGARSMRSSGMSRGGGGRGGRRSDIVLKHDIALLGRLENGLGFYRFVYNGGHTSYVGVLAQEVQAVMPSAVSRGSDGYLRVDYEKLGLIFQRYDRWVATGAQIPHLWKSPAQAPRKL
jgi:hypothetical protein